MPSSFREHRTRAGAALSRSRAIGAVTLGAGLLFAVLSACARSVDGDLDDLNPPLFGSDASNPSPTTACVQTACPAPWATCTSDGLCTTDTSSDVNHCGSCDKSCATSKNSHATPVCTGGTCSFGCDELYVDCNKNPADGCEVYVGDDPNNCGGCGVKCDSGVICWKGACGCPSGFTQCGDDCKDTSSDDMNCGSCGNLCVAPKPSDPSWICGSDVSPINTTWQCTTGACKLECQPPYQDCDGDFCGDGCETDTSKDRNNCGACGNVCTAGQDCVDGTCICPVGTTRCGHSCVDVTVDPLNCGECGNECPGPGGFGEKAVGGGPSCAGGVCSYVCYPGYRDCNGRVNDGCEVNVAQDPKHCGDCTTKCNTAQGQPCVDGVCLTKPCDPSAPVN